MLLLGRLASGEPNDALDWWLVPVDGGTSIKTGALEVLERQGLSPPPGELRIVPASWPAASQSVAFAARLGDTTNLWELKLSRQTRKVTEPAARLTFGTGVEVQASLASGPDGGFRMVYSDLRPNVDVWTVPVDANQGAVTGPMQPVTENISFDGYPAISADGEKLAFISARSGNRDVWTRDLKTGKEVSATATPFQELQPILSADGSKIFYWVNEDQQRPVYQANFSGGVPTKLCDGCGTPTDVFEGYLLLEPLGRPPAFAIIELATNRIRFPSQAVFLQMAVGSLSMRLRRGRLRPGRSSWLLSAGGRASQRRAAPTGFRSQTARRWTGKATGHRTVTCSISSQTGTASAASGLSRWMLLRSGQTARQNPFTTFMVRGGP